jgi:hypothetical protein
VISRELRILVVNILGIEGGDGARSLLRNAGNSVTLPGATSPNTVLFGELTVKNNIIANLYIFANICVVDCGDHTFRHFKNFLGFGIFILIPKLRKNLPELLSNVRTQKWKDSPSLSF